MTKSDLQEYAANSAFSLLRCSLVYPPGFGKSRMKILIAQKVVESMERRARVLIVAHRAESRDKTLPAEFGAWGASSLLLGGQVRICLYHQLGELAGEPWDAVICDEAHYLNMDYARFLAGINPKWLVLVTATPPREEEKALIFKGLVGNARVSMPLAEAIERGDLNDYRLRIFTYDIVGKEWELYFELCKKLQWAQRKSIKGAQDAIIGQRLNFIYSLPSKLANTIELNRRAKELGLRRLIFVGRKDVADQISPHRLHSGVSRDDFERFQAGEIDEIVTVNQIQEGSNIKNLPLIIVGQTNGTSYGLLQKLGRGLRLDPEETAQIWLLCAQNTQDLSWVHKGIKDIDPKKISWEPFV